MRRACVVGCPICVALVFAAFSASSAFALESTWLVDGAKSAAAFAVDSVGELVLEDSKGGPFGEAISVECQMTDAGIVGPGRAGEISQITLSSCKGGKICGSPLSIVASHLLWETNIELIGSSFYDDIVAKSGEVGYTMQCTVFGFTVEDTCKWSLGRALLANSGSNVKMLFSTADVNQPSGNCTLGGTGTGLLSGIDTQLSTEGLTIAVSEG
jgi:hypothetical protein